MSLSCLLHMVACLLVKSAILLGPVYQCRTAGSVMGQFFILPCRHDDLTFWGD